MKFCTFCNKTIGQNDTFRLVKTAKTSIAYMGYEPILAVSLTIIDKTVFIDFLDKTVS